MNPSDAEPQSTETSLLSGALARVAREIVESVTPQLPADQALRRTLAAQKGLSRSDSRKVARAVFAFYRWKGWLADPHPYAPQLRQCLEHQNRYDAGEWELGEDELRARAVPAWVGGEMDVSLEWLQAIQHEPSLWLRSRPGQRDSLEMRLNDCVSAPLVQCDCATSYQGGKDLFREPAFHEGAFEIQDLASQLVGLVCDPKGGETWWDACSGEGGKLLHLSDLMQNKGMIWASDRSEWRLKRLKQRTARAKAFNYRAVLWPRLEVLPTKTKFDGVLVDAPCSGMGTWQRNPHARWYLDPVEIREMADVQRSILSAVLPSLKPGGRLVYSVCTLSRQETVDVVDWMEKKFPQLRPEPWSVEGLEMAEGGRPHAWTVWPQELGTQGMYIARWRVGSAQ